MTFMELTWPYMETYDVYFHGSIQLPSTEEVDVAPRKSTQNFTSLEVKNLISFFRIIESEVEGNSGIVMVVEVVKLPWK